MFQQKLSVPGTVESRFFKVLNMYTVTPQIFEKIWKCLQACLLDQEILPDWNNEDKKSCRTVSLILVFVPLL